MKTQRNVKSFFVGKDIVGNKASTTDGGALLDVYTDLADGEVILVDAGNTVLDSASAGAAKKFRFVQRSGTKLLFSPFIDPYSVSEFKIATYSAPVQQISYIGYNTSTGSIRLTNSNQYIARIYFQESDRVGFGQQLVKYGIYESDASATQLEVAEGLYNSFINNFAREPQKDVYFEMVSDDTQADWTGGTGVTFTNGSNVVTFTEGATGTVATGAYIRSAQEGVYKVLEGCTAGTSFTLEQPFEGTTASEAGGTTIGTNAGILASPSDANFGIRIVGKERPFTQGVHKENYSVVRFQIGLDGFGVTEIDYATGAVEGNGTWQQMSEEEYLAQGNEGDYHRIGNIPPKVSRTDVVEDATYDVLTLHFEDQTDTEGMGAVAYSPQEVMVACATNSSDSGTQQFEVATNGLAYVLEAALTGRMKGYAAQHTNITNYTA